MMTAFLMQPWSLIRKHGRRGADPSVEQAFRRCHWQNRFTDLHRGR